MTNLNYIDPTTLEEAIQKLAEAKAEGQLIQSHLGDRNRLVDGRRMTNEEYWTWKKKAAIALQYKNDEIRRLKSWIATHKIQRKQSCELSGNFKELKEKLTRSLGEFIDYTEALERLVASLTKENADLVTQLPTYEDKQ